MAVGWVSALVWVVLWLYRSGQREKREQREERANEKKREKFSEEMRGERKNPKEISVDMVGSELKKISFLIFTKCTVTFQK